MSAPHMPMMNNSGVLNCPFCGSDDAYPDTDGKRHFVWCGNCGCGTGPKLNRPAAIRKWNTRNGHLYTPEDYKQAGQERDYGL